VHVELPFGAVTGVGSLPHTDAAAAAAFVLERWPELPSVPSLPQRSPWERMLGQVSVGVRGVTIDDQGRLVVDAERVNPRVQIVPDLDHDAFGGLRAFLAAAAGRKGPVKWQLTGPVTYGMALWRAGLVAPVAFDVAIRAVRVHLRAIHKAIAQALPACPQVVVLDEPSMSGVQREDFPLAPDAAIDLVSGALAAIETTTLAGIHCCRQGERAPDWPAILAAGPGLLSLPADPSLVDVAGHLADFLDQGGSIAWGAIPTDRPVAASADRYWRELAAVWCDLVAAGCDPGAIRRQALVTPACGLGLHDEASANLVADLLQDIGDRVAGQAVATRLTIGA
jgi:methionine synthase II (cobalamin-independent)